MLHLDRLDRSRARLRTRFRHDPEREEEVEVDGVAGGIGWILDRATAGGEGVDAVGHRVVHGGETFQRAVRIDPLTLQGIRSLGPLAPLHNPINLRGIESALERFPELPQVAVFDTAFHADMPEVARQYAIPPGLAAREGIRRFGFHGSAHAWVARVLSGMEPPPIRAILLHLGSGCSACALLEGRSVDTSMGFSPLEGLVMGTRCGDIDPAAVLHLMECRGWSTGDALGFLNRQSGLLGLSGRSADMARLLDLEGEGDPGAARAIELFVYRARQRIGSLAAALGGLEAVAFTGGIGENSPVVRERILSGLGFLGVRTDPEANHSISPEQGGVFHAGPVRLLVVPSGEDREIALETRDCVDRAP